jgi:hypothetical protein
MFNDISPFFFSAQPDGTIALVGSQAQLNTTSPVALHAKGIKVVPTVGSTWSPDKAQAVFTSPALTHEHVTALVHLVRSNGFDGIDLDYEGFAFTDGTASWPTTQPVWVAFVTELANALHANGKLLSVTIPPTWIEAGVVRGYPVYAPADIGAVADRVKLMVYDWSVGSPGPISPMTWVNLVIAYNDPIVPNNKLQLGIPAYGRDWGRQVNAGEICPDGALATHSIELTVPGTGRVDRAFELPPIDLVEAGSVSGRVVEPDTTTPIPAPPCRRLRQRRRQGCSCCEPCAGRPPLTPPTEQLVHCPHFVYYPDCDHRPGCTPSRDQRRLGWCRAVGLGLRTPRSIRPWQRTAS